jgi:predicted DNA-binding transcriptional regulator AlpA
MTAHLLSSGQVAALLGVSRQRVNVLRRLPGFPAQAGRTAGGRVWWDEDIQEWQRRYRSAGVRLPNSVNPSRKGAE